MMNKIENILTYISLFLSVYTLLKLDILIAIYFILLAIFVRLNSVTKW